MIFGIHARWRALRRLFSRSEWMVKLLGLPRRHEGDSSQGLVMIQIDGLSHTERGIPSSGATDHAAQLAKRERKLLGYE